MHWCLIKLYYTFRRTIPNSEEVAVGLMDIVPFTLEETFIKLGAKFEKTANFQPFAVRDGLLITGQNPSSTNLVAAHFIAALNDSI